MGFFKSIARKLPPTGPLETPKRLRVCDSDVELVQALRQGREEAATRFYERYRPLVSRTLYRILRTTEEHDELVQKAMVEAMLSIDAFRGKSTLDAWVMGIASNVGLKHLRSVRSERRWLDLDGEAQTAALEVQGPQDPAERSEYRSLLFRVQDLLGKLDEKKATVFVLHEVLGHSLGEVAALLNISEANAQTRLVRGRRELHALVAAEPALSELLRTWGGAG